HPAAAFNCLLGMASLSFDTSPLFMISISLMVSLDSTYFSHRRTPVCHPIQLQINESAPPPETAEKGAPYCQATALSRHPIRYCANRRATRRTAPSLIRQLNGRECHRTSLHIYDRPYPWRSAHSPQLFSK